MCERTVVRKMYGDVKEGERGIRTNKEMTKMEWSC
jgi:hypothetical protein